MTRSYHSSPIDVNLYFYNFFIVYILLSRKGLGVPRNSIRIAWFHYDMGVQRNLVSLILG